MERGKHGRKEGTRERLNSSFSSVWGRDSDESVARRRLSLNEALGDNLLLHIHSIIADKAILPVVSSNWLLG